MSDEPQVEMVRASNLGCLVSTWREQHGFDDSSAFMVAKLAEEVGEVARAVIGDIEGRDGRGDAVQESAQVVLLLAALVSVHYDADIFVAVEAEARRVGILQ